MTIQPIAKSQVLYACAALVASLAYSQPTPQAPIQPEGKTPASQPRSTSTNNPIADLVLIYAGGEGRLPWTVERFKPYVYREEQGQVEWLFDGFLFLDFFAKSGARLCPISHRKDATQADWQSLMDDYFQAGQNFAALEQLLDDLAARGQQPKRKRQVVIALPTPITGSNPNRIEVSSAWGALKGSRVDFNQAEDRLKAAHWYVDEVLRRWQEKHYKHLELAGFYWLFERAWGANHTEEIGQYIRGQGSRLYWIPSWPQGRKNWRQYGFDFVYQQPNYFFHRQPTRSERLEEACAFAEGCGTSMEMEFNKDLLTKPPFLSYFDQYLQAYEKHQVWDKRPVAYYEGAGAWADMAASSEPAVKSRYEAMSEILVKRQKKADQGFVFRQEAK